MLTDLPVILTEQRTAELLDRAPKRHDEDEIPAGQWWWRRHDEYEDGEGR